MSEREKPAAADEAGRRETQPGFDYGLLPELIGYNLRRAQDRVFNDFMTSMAAHDVTPGQFGVLTLIEANTGLNQTQLGNAIGIDRSTVVAVIDRLEDRGLVERAPSPTDRRSYALRLSPDGARLVEMLRPLVRRHEARIAADLTADEQETLRRLLRRIADGR